MSRKQYRALWREIGQLLGEASALWEEAAYREPEPKRVAKLRKRSRQLVALATQKIKQLENV